MTEMLDSVGYRGRVATLVAMSQALQRALHSWDGLLEWLPVGIYTCDAEGCLVQYNRHAAEIWGRSPDVGDGQVRLGGAPKAFAANGAQLSPEAAPMAELLATGKPIRIGSSSSSDLMARASPSLPISIRCSMTRDASSEA